MTLITPILNSIAIQKSPEVFHAKNWGLNWGDELLNELKFVALKSALKRARLCLHPDSNDIHQEMLIVMHRTAVELPQRRTNGFDTKIVLEGEAIFSYYTEIGEKIKELRLNRGTSCYLNTASTEFHNLKIISEWFVFLEFLEGPFTPNTTEFASF
jgi:cupin fold WbuC family metalloprotein